ncbi:MAG: hypothetical protein IJS83_04950 [Acholeplasmatales bacterium]|nr:hypothetical protein [Acholeplasmatales bacterium]
MKRKYYKESFIALAVVLFFDFLRLFYVITTGVSNVFDYLWIILLLVLVYFTYISNQDKKYIHILTIVLGFLTTLFVLLNTILISSTGLIFDFNYFFMLFEGLLVTGINIVYIVEYMKYIKKNEENENISE